MVDQYNDTTSINSRVCHADINCAMSHGYGHICTCESRCCVNSNMEQIHTCAAQHSGHHSHTKRMKHPMRKNPIDGRETIIRRNSLVSLWNVRALAFYPSIEKLAAFARSKATWTNMNMKCGQSTSGETANYELYLRFNCVASSQYRCACRCLFSFDGRALLTANIVIVIAIVYEAAAAAPATTTNTTRHVCIHTHSHTQIHLQSHTLVG